MVENSWRRLSAAVLLLALGLAGGCADQQKVREEDLAELHRLAAGALRQYGAGGAGGAEVRDPGARGDRAA